MNVKVETVPVEDPSDPTKKMQRTILVATREFKVGDEIYKVRIGPPTSFALIQFPGKPGRGSTRHRPYWHW